MNNGSVNAGDLIISSVDMKNTGVVSLCAGQVDVTLKRSELLTQIKAVAHGLLARGLQRGQRVAVIANNSTQLLSVLLGTMYAGLVIVPLSTKFSKATSQQICEECEVALIFSDEEFTGQVPAGIQNIDLGSLFQQFPHWDDLAPAATRPNDVACILYTSGSTGRPKGVQLSHHGLVWPLRAHIDNLVDVRGERFLIAAPLFHMNAMFFAMLALYGGGSIVLLSRFSTEQYTLAINAYQCTYLTAIPTMLALVTQKTISMDINTCPSVRYIDIGSAPSTVALFERVSAVFPFANVMNSYGSTEAGPTLFGSHPNGLPRPRMSIGYPVTGVETKFLGEGEARVMMIRSPSLMLGYLNNQEETDRVVVDGWFYTGDLVRKDTHGFYYIVGRADDMFICGGENIYPAEVESILENHDAIEQACVVAAADEIMGSVPVAFVVKQAGSDLKFDEIKAYVQREGSAYLFPRYVEFIDELPRTGTEKIDRKRLEAEVSTIVNKSKGSE